jgi:hypothetical protein
MQVKHVLAPDTPLSYMERSIIHCKKDREKNQYKEFK